MRIKDAPIYGKNTDNEIISFINRYLSTNSSFLDENILKIQTHHHTKTCRKNQHSKFRFNFLLPPINKVVILHPLEHSDHLLQQKAKEIFAILENREYKKNTTFDDFLMDFQLTRDNYILLIRSLLDPSKLIQKRDPSDIWINPFAKSIPKLWQANTDAQFVLDAYAATTYVSSYITKFDCNLTTAFEKIKDQCLADNDGKIQTIRKHGNALLNMQQMSIS